MHLFLLILFALTLFQAYLKDAYDLLYHTLKNEPRAKVDLDSLPYRCLILDYGMRIGIWSIEIVECVRHLHGRVVGYDITDMHLPMDKLLDNLTIAIGDDERVWREGTPFDIIHARVVESIVD
ncbi:hypothetical protein CNYM01_13768 [Colletotrichum nymphaeae SA-01]|uniref:Methyltransferase domain-containing protein n=1 Tax=Colletotrichum nymphaeae SA-01 TaxID=1460502 RepID=A0A135U5Z0_9PEZI|nr:hypothetical protein CNYM01_13768 [Colletotrichum nymphaeae SA-01]